MWGDDYRSGSIAASQAQIGELETEAAIIREYQPSMMPSIVQTVAYAREMLTTPGGPVLVGATPDAVEALIGERVKRQALLYEPAGRYRSCSRGPSVAEHCRSARRRISADQQHMNGPTYCV